MTVRDGLRKAGVFLARRVTRGVGRRGEKGSALVEFAVTMPLLMIVLAGSASISLALYYLQQVGNATSSAVMSVGGEANLFPNGDPCAAAKSFVTSALPNISPSKLTLTLTITDTSLNTDTYSGTGSSFTCTSAPSMEANYPVTLTVTYAYSWLPVPHFSWLPGFTFVPSGNLTSTQAAIQM
ncbi:MAG: TadE family protein [Terracidiphilus sp.]|jgi:Flp pilus assembly protein TadG